jgi:radical SAM superfamily enzyme YgiQ (UPF0313 family)
VKAKPLGVIHGAGQQADGPDLGLRPGSRVLLVEPPFYRLFGYERFHYPITLTLIATWLERQGHHVRVFDADKPTPECRPLSRVQVIESYPRYERALLQDDHPIWSQVEATIRDYQPDVVGLTAITAKIDAADRVAKLVKRISGGKIKVILGGPHVQGMLLVDARYDFGPWYDQVVPSVPGLMTLTPNKSLIMNHETYSPENMSVIMTSTGCPGVCTFCCHSYEKTISYRTPQSVRQELVDIKARSGGKPPVYVMDDCLFSNAVHLRETMASMRSLDLRFAAASRIMALTQEKIGAFVAGGGVKIMVGVESGSQRVLDRVEKKLKVEEIVRRTRWLNDAGLAWSAFFVVGFPFETLDDLKLTEELVDRIQPTFASANRFTPYPGTKIFEEYFSERRPAFKDLYQLNRSSCVALPEDVEEFIERLFVKLDAYNERNRRARLAS